MFVPSAHMGSKETIPGQTEYSRVGMHSKYFTMVRILVWNVFRFRVQNVFQFFLGIHCNSRPGIQIPVTPVRMYDCIVGMQSTVANAYVGIRCSAFQFVGRCMQYWEDFTRELLAQCQWNGFGEEVKVNILVLVESS